MPFPICKSHARSVCDSLHDRAPEVDPRAMLLRTAIREPVLPTQSEVQAKRERRKAAYAKQSQVYYVRIGDHVKIGYTTNVRARMNQLRVDISEVLATEPGDRDLERRRHREFAEERQGRRENFNPSRRLLAHIEALKEQHGEPNITGYFYVA